MELSAIKGSTVLVTGATDGIGRVAATELAKAGARVLIVGRNEERLETAAAGIRGASGHNHVVPLLADLSVMGEVATLADQVRKHTDHLDVLLNNAGAMFSQRMESADGIEMTFALNHLAYFILTLKLMDLLSAAPAARIVNVASRAHEGQRLDFDDLENRKSYNSYRVYGQSKLANIYFTYALARRLKGTPITANALHPGFVRTGFPDELSGIFKMIVSLAAPIAAISPEDGARTSLYLAASPEVAGVSGRYFVRCKAVESSSISRSETIAEKLWTVSEEMTGLRWAL